MAHGLGSAKQVIEMKAGGVKQWCLPRIRSGGSRGTRAVRVAVAVRTRSRDGNWAVKPLLVVVIRVAMMVVEAVMQWVHLSRDSRSSGSSGSLVSSV